MGRPRAHLTAGAALDKEVLWTGLQIGGSPEELLCHYSRRGLGERHSDIAHRPPMCSNPVRPRNRDSSSRMWHTNSAG
jgi:hypothetical protein